MSTKKEREAAEAVKVLRDILKPGDTVYTILKSVSRSGMYRHVKAVIQGKDGVRDISGYVAEALGWRWHDDGSVGVSGCGMDVGFHMVHTLGYAMFGHEAEHGKGKAANALRRALFKVDPHYYTQGGKDAPNPNKPDRVWFGGAGYALKHRWL